MVNPKNCNDLSPNTTITKNCNDSSPKIALVLHKKLYSPTIATISLDILTTYFKKNVIFMMKRHIFIHFTNFF